MPDGTEIRHVIMHIFASTITCTPGVLPAQCTSNIMCVRFIYSFIFTSWLFPELYSDWYRWRKLANLIKRHQSGGKLGGVQIPQTFCQQRQRLRLSIKLAGAQSVSKHNFASSDSQAPSCAFKRSGGSIDFQEGRNTQVEPQRLQPSKSALFPATHEEPCWAQSQEPNTGGLGGKKVLRPLREKLLTQSNSAVWQQPSLFPNVGSARSSWAGLMGEGRTEEKLQDSH